MRYRQTTPSGGTIYYVDKLMEIENFNTTTDYRHYLGDIAILTKTGDLNDPNPGIKYLFRDRLGSTATIGDTTGLSVESRAFDPFGKPRNGDWTDKSPPVIGSGITDRGFTDHEHLDDWQLIHMNGRAYDYNLGRFLSVDPIIQAPGNSQSINGYTYIFNNPLSGTDPTGYCSAETGTRIKDCVEVNVVDKDSGEVATTELNRMHSGFAGQVGEFITDTLGNGAQISGAIATFESGAIVDLMGQGSTTAFAAPSNGTGGGGTSGGSTVRKGGGQATNEPELSPLPPAAAELFQDPDFLTAVHQGKQAAAHEMKALADGPPTLGPVRPIDPGKLYPFGSIIRKRGILSLFRIPFGNYYVDEVSQGVANGAQEASPNVSDRLIGTPNLAGVPWQITGAAAVVIVLPTTDIYPLDISETKRIFSEHEGLFPVITFRGDDVAITIGDQGPYSWPNKDNGSQQ